MAFLFVEATNFNIISPNVFPSVSWKLSIFIGNEKKVSLHYFLMGCAFCFTSKLGCLWRWNKHLFNFESQKIQVGCSYEATHVATISISQFLKSCWKLIQCCVYYHWFTTSLILIGDGKKVEFGWCSYVSIAFLICMLCNSPIISKISK